MLWTLYKGALEGRGRKIGEYWGTLQEAKEYALTLPEAFQEEGVAIYNRNEPEAWVADDTVIYGKEGK